VQLVKGTSIIGCTLVGEIDGAKNGDAKIGEAEIEPDTILSNVCLTPTVQYNPSAVTLGAGVKTHNNPVNPTPEDFCITPKRIPFWNSKNIIGVEPKAFTTFDAEHVADIPVKAVDNIVSEQLAEFTKNGLSGMTTVQFEDLAVISLSGLQSDNIAGFSTEVIDQFALSHLEKLNDEQFKQMPSEDVSKLFTNFDGEKITPVDVESLVPSDWQVDSETGELTAPAGAKLTLRALPTPKDLSESVELPADMVNLNEGFGLGGAGTPVIEGLQDALVTTDLKNLAISQNDMGIFHSNPAENKEEAENKEDCNDCSCGKCSFIPDVDNIRKVDLQKETIGLSIGKGGFGRLTTPDGMQVSLIPAPHDPVALSKATGGKVVMGKSGDVLIELSNQKRSRGSRGDTNEVVIPGPRSIPPAHRIPPVKEPKPANSGQGVVSNNSSSLTFYPDNSSPNTFIAKYDDSNTQTFFSTVRSPSIFIAKGKEIPKVEDITYNANGTFSAIFSGNCYLLTRVDSVRNKRLAKAEKFEPKVDIDSKTGRVNYEVQAGSNALSFELTINPVPMQQCGKNF
jgi:hypothetical protein